jgi:two-component system, OmpR family, response regulator
MSIEPYEKTRSFGEQEEQGSYRFDGWRLDRKSECLTTPSGASVALTKGEYAVLLAFLEHPHRLLPRGYLAEVFRVRDDTTEVRIDVHILGLRRKLETDPSMPRIILTERGIGYRFVMKVELP